MSICVYVCMSVCACEHVRVGVCVCDCFLAVATSMCVFVCCVFVYMLFQDLWLCVVCCVLCVVRVAGGEF